MIQASSRRTDPATSVEAAKLIEGTGKAARHRRILLDKVRQVPGQTAGELARFAVLDRHEVSRRLPELRPMFVESRDPRKCRELGTKAMTWWPADPPEVTQGTLIFESARGTVRS